LKHLSGTTGSPTDVLSGRKPSFQSKLGLNTAKFKKKKLESTGN